MSQATENPSSQTTENSSLQIMENSSSQTTENPLSQTTKNSLSQGTENPLPQATEKPLWQKTKNPLYGLLIGAYVSNVMRRIYPSQEDFVTNHRYYTIWGFNQKLRYYETTALDLFENIYTSDSTSSEDLEYQVLAYDYEGVYTNE